MPRGKQRRSLGCDTWDIAEIFNRGLLERDHFTKTNCTWEQVANKFQKILRNESGDTSITVSCRLAKMACEKLGIEKKNNTGHENRFYAKLQERIVELENRQDFLENRQDTAFDHIQALIKRITELEEALTRETNVG